MWGLWVNVKDVDKNLLNGFYKRNLVSSGLRKPESINAEPGRVFVCVCVCVCVCGHVYVVYEDTNLYNDMGIT